MAHDTQKNGPLSEVDNDKEDLMDIVKGNGPWQWLIFTLICICTLTDGSNNMSMTFLAPNTEYWCARPPGTNISIKEWKEIALPPGDYHCSRYRWTVNFGTSHSIEHFENNSSRNETIPCDSWEYDDAIYSSTIVSQWNLVCEREWLVSLSKSVFIVGIFISSSVFAYLADRFGRKPVVMFCNALAILSGISCIFSTSFLIFAISRIFVSAGVTGAVNIGSILMLEAVGPKNRSPYYIGVNVAWIVGAQQLPLIAWLLGNWIWMEIVLILPNVIFLFSWWLLPESPRWLLANGKTKHGLKVMMQAAKRNGIKISDETLQEKITKTKKFQSEENENPSVRVLQLFEPELRVRTLVMWFIWSATAFIYYGISYNTNDLAGDPFINFTIYNLIELPSCILSLLFIEYKGRKKPLFWSFVCSGVACLLIYPFPEDPWWMKTSMALLGKFFISSAFFIIMLFTTEVFPTLLRNVGIGSASAVARFAAILAPFVRELGIASHPVVPQILFGVFSFASAGLSLLLPETTNRSVPDTVKEAAEIPM